MNTKTTLVVSLLLNLALAGTIAYLVMNRSELASPVAAVTASASNAALRVVGKQTGAVPAASAKPAQSFDWRLVESEDYKKYIANLRAIGCPEETIRDIIIADVNKLFESRKQAMKVASTNKFQFWKAGNPFAAMMDPDRIQKQQELNKEKRALLKELLGVTVDEKPDLFAAVNPFETMLDFLPSSKQTQIMEVMQSYQAKLMKGLGGGAPDTEDMKQIQKVQKEMDAELAKILTPQEKEDYDLRLSQTAMMMRMQLASFDPNEQEFRDVFKLKKKFDDEYSVLGVPSQDKADQEKRAAAQKELDAQIKNALGEPRFVEYQRSSDFAYQGIAKVAEREGLSKDSAVKVYDMKKIAEEQATKLRQEKSLSTEQRQQALQAVRAETERSIKEVFGDKAFESYQKQPTAYWLKGLSSDPKP